VERADHGKADVELLFGRTILIPL